VRQGKVRAIGEAATFATADDLNASQAIAAVKWPDALCHHGGQLQHPGA
jgi:hypothetical protein